MSSFLGRKAQVAEVATTLRTARLVTLTGIGGVGKSRLAVQVAKAVAPEYASTAWAQVGSVVGARNIVGAVLQALGRQARTSNDAPASVEPGSGLLLVLDNCEHVIDGCAELVHALLERFAGLRVLATSREPLGVPGEVVLPITPLPLPRSEEPVDRLVQNDAIALFVERARARLTSFQLTPESTELVAGICRSLDGIPLAIELAAAQITTMTLADIARRLDDPLELLTCGGRTDTPRHQTLRASLDWSYALLKESERRLLRSVSIFDGSFSSDAAASVCATADMPAAKIPALLHRLVAQSLVQAWQQDGTNRFGLIDAVRSYALSLLSEAREEHFVRDRHLQWCLSLADRVSIEPLDPELMSRLRCDERNLRTALHWAIRSSRADEGMHLALVLGRVWLHAGCLPDGVRSLMDATASGSQAMLESDVWRAPNSAIHKPFSAGETTIVAPVRTASMSVDVVTATRASVDEACCAADGGRDVLTGTGAEGTPPGAERRKPEPWLNASTSVRFGTVAPLRSALAAGASAPAEGERCYGGGDAVKLRLVGGVDRDDWTKQHSVPTHAARDKDAARLLDAPGAVQPAKSPPPSTLSERELDVVRLVTGGRSNREIAEELVISRKTAEAHVSHILTKLGLWRRVQIATWSLQHGVGLAEAH